MPRSSVEDRTAWLNRAAALAEKQPLLIRTVMLLLLGPLWASAWIVATCPRTSLVCAIVAAGTFSALYVYGVIPAEHFVSAARKIGLVYVIFAAGNTLQYLLETAVASIREKWLWK